MTYGAGGELFDYVVDKGTLSEEEACIIIRKITSAIAHMHGLNIIHRDLKPENLLLTTKGMYMNISIVWAIIPSICLCSSYITDLYL